MKPARFDYRAPETLDEALALLADPSLRVVVLAGGQSLVPLLNARIVRPGVLLDINRIAGLDGIVLTEGAVSIGALARLADIEHHAGLAQALPVLAQGLLYVSHPQVRSRSTLGGTLNWAEPTAETPMMCLALEATFALVSTGGTRTVAADDYFRSRRVTARRPDELLVRTDIPIPTGFQFRFNEFARRGHGDFPYVSLCAGVRLVGDEVADARISAGGVAGRPVRLRGAEEALIGRRLEDDLDDVLALAVKESDPPGDRLGSADFRRGVLRTLLRKTLNEFDARTALV